MGIFDWLFGRSTPSEVTPRPASGPQWESSENGNPCIIHKNRRITVFASDRGWKFCVAKIENDNNPFFSEVYRTDEAAKYEALAHVDRRPSKHATLSQDNRDARRLKWEALIVDKEKLFSELSGSLVSTTSVTELRKIERKVDTQIRQDPRLITDYYRDGISDQFVIRAEKTAKEFELLKSLIEARAAELNAARRVRKPLS
jgi:hypothetical protein